MDGRRVILASQSPRRRELLGRLIPTFTVRTDDAPEVTVPGESPEQLVQRLAGQKAVNVARRAGAGALVLAADTVVVLEGQILGKPRDPEEAFRMLSALSGKTHSVYTGLAVLDTGSGKEVRAVQETKVRFRPLTPEEIRAYIRTGEPMDKAGAYGIQELGALLVEGIDGDYFTVVGLPLCRLGTILKEEFQYDLLTGQDAG